MSCGFDPYDYPTFDNADLPRGLRHSLKFLTKKQIRLCTRLCEMGQEHFFDDWERLAPGGRRQFCEYLEDLEGQIAHGGLEDYIDKIRRLLIMARSDQNRWEGWTASAPAGTSLTMGEEDFEDAEVSGVRHMAKVGFVLNAFHMGTDVGFDDALVKMEVELTTRSSYLQTYIQHVLAIQKRWGDPDQKVPLCILTSPQTYEPVCKYLEEHSRFGMERGQLTILVPKGGVPCADNYRGRIAWDPDDKAKLMMLPEGDGCIHTLIHNEGITKDWMKKGIKYVYFFEGANSLALQALPYMLYVSKLEKLVLNFLAVPRKAKEPMDALVKLSSKEKGFVGTVCADHRELEDLLTSTEYFQGDQEHQSTRLSPFPGATHTMLMLLEVYDEVLERTGGELPGSLHPKPTRAPDKKSLLEPVRATSRVTDISQVLDPEQSELVGITMMEANFCYAPVKDSAVATAELRRRGIPVYTASSAEAAVYEHHRRILRSIGCRVDEGHEETYHDLALTLNPNLVFHPSFCLTISDYKDRFPDPSKIIISRRSTLVVRGADVVIQSLNLDGCLLIDTDEGFSAKVNGKVWNRGWEIVPLSADDNDPDLCMRGYKVDRLDKKVIEAYEESSSCSIL